MAIICLLAAVSPLSWPACAFAADAPNFSSDIQPLLKKHCFECHGDSKQESQIRFDRVDGFRAEDRNLWTSAHEKIAAGEMPPKEHAQPSTQQKQQLLTWIEQQQRAFKIATTRRLNRREFSAALRNVTGLSVDYTFSMPGDGKIAGFDTGAEALQDTADSVAQSMRITRRAVDAIRFLEPSPGKLFSADLASTKDPKKLLESWRDQGAYYKPSGTNKPGGGLMLEPTWLGDRGGLNFSIPLPADRAGVMRLKLVVSVHKPLAGIPNPRLWVEIGKQDIDYHEITGTFDRPQTLVYEVQIDDLATDARGVNFNLSNKIEIPYSIAGFPNDERSPPDKPVPGGTGLYRPAFDKKTVPHDKQPLPFIVLHQMEVDGDYVASWPPADWKVDVKNLRDDADSASRLLKLFIDRAWRRPASPAEREPFAKLYRQERAQGTSFDDALRAAFQSVLLSAPFRFLASPDQADPQLSQYAIASRLSFMLVGQPPDAELRRLAGEGKLRDPATLDAQVDRLLDDPRSESFVRGFVVQWLEAEQPITLVMEHLQKQDFRFGRYLKSSMREETIAYVAQIFKENRPIRELISSDWTMMNDSLAIHYNYPTIDGGTLRKTKLKADDPRGGGILGHAGLQSMLCWMGDNWVIYRGAWAARHILDFPPPPPPLEVPELNPADGKNRGKTFRELLKQHQEDTRCSVCHKVMDPVGFAFQNFDISGRWRDVEHESYSRSEIDGKIAWVGAGKTRPVDAAGKMPRGETFQTFAEFKQLIAKNYQDDLVRGLMKNFLVYGTGRIPDVEAVREISTAMKEMRTKEYPARGLVKAVVRSGIFLGR